MLQQVKEKIAEKIPQKEFYFPQNFNSFEMYRDMMGFLNYFAKCIGCDAFSVDYTAKNSIFISSIIFSILFLIEHAYWIYHNFNNAMELMFILTTLPFLPQGAVRIWAFIVNRDKLIDVFLRMREFHEKYYSPLTRRVLEESVVRSCNLCILLSAVMSSGAFFIAIYPGIVYAVSGKFKFFKLCDGLNFFRQISPSFWLQAFIYRLDDYIRIRSKLFSSHSGNFYVFGIDDFGLHRHINLCTLLLRPVQCAGDIS